MISWWYQWHLSLTNLSTGTDSSGASHHKLKVVQWTLMYKCSTRFWAQTLGLSSSPIQLSVNLESESLLSLGLAQALSLLWQWPCSCSISLFRWKTLSSQKTPHTPCTTCGNLLLVLNPATRTTLHCLLRTREGASCQILMPSSSQAVCAVVT